MVLLARFRPARKLMADTGEGAVPAGDRRRCPSLVGWATVMLSATATAEAGTPQRPWMGTVRTTSEDNAGPSAGSRVS